MSEKSDGKPPESDGPKGAMPRPRDDEIETERILPISNARPRAVYVAPELCESRDKPGRQRLKIQHIFPNTDGRPER
jgi:hypothetical protein